MQDQREACGKLRHSLVHCMRCGDRLVINLGDMAPDFKEVHNFPPDHWPSHELFDFSKWRSDDNYMKVVHADENHDVDKNPDRYYMHDNFLLIILANY